MTNTVRTLQIQGLIILATLLVAGGGLFFGMHTLLAQEGQQLVDARRAALEAELSELEKEIQAQRVVLEDKQREKVSLERDVAILDAQINEATLSIRARDLTIRKLTTEINGKEQTIGVLSDKLAREKESLAQLLRKTHQIDSFSLVEVVLSGENLSDFFIDLDSFEAIKESLQDSFVVIEDTKETTTEEKLALEETQREESELRQLQALQRQRIQEKRAERNELLRVTKGQEEAYQEILRGKEKTAAQIRAELFSLRGSEAIPFGRALDLAMKASARTGVRPALILGIMREETNLGENIGNCNLPTDPPEYKWYSIMKSPRDTEPYLDITSRLGLDPEMMPLSCAPGYGWGGAMGPAQFIPSTWVLYEDRIAEMTGHIPPNPWDPEDAFMASAILLMDNGATDHSFAAERLAALRYFAGWKNASNPAYAFYGNDVMEFAGEYQKQIEILSR